MYYPNYYRWFDWATHELVRHAGYPVTAMLADGHAIPLVETGAKFSVPLVFDDELTIRSRVSEVRIRSFRVDHTICRGDETACVGYEARIWVRLGPGGDIRPEPLTESMRRQLLGKLSG